MSKIEINTRDYENTHGRKPRGSGMWFVRFSALGMVKEDRMMFAPSYGAVVKDARTYAEQIDADTVIILP